MSVGLYKPGRYAAIDIGTVTARLLVADVDSEDYRDVTAFDGLNGDDYVFTNIFDMFKWDRVLREGKVITLEEQKLMYTPGKLNNGENAGFAEQECCEGD